VQVSQNENCLDSGEVAKATSTGDRQFGGWLAVVLLLGESAKVLNAPFESN